jgi:hypothetical protein
MLLDDRSVALEIGQSVNAKKVVKINICKENLFISDAPFRRSIKT